MSGAAKSIALFTVLLAPVGCGGAAGRVADSRKNAALAAEQGSAAYAKGDYAAAAEQLQAALAAGGMSPDLYASVRVKLAVCYAAAGKLQEAAESLDALEKARPISTKSSPCAALCSKSRASPPKPATLSTRPGD